MGAEFNVLSIVITGVVAALATVITGNPTAAVALSVAAVEALGEAVKTAEPKKLVIEGHAHLRDTARQFLDAADDIERDVAEAIKQLGDNLRAELDRVRGLRRY